MKTTIDEDMQRRIKKFVANFKNNGFYGNSQSKSRVVWCKRKNLVINLGAVRKRVVKNLVQKSPRPLMILLPAQIMIVKELSGKN